jgi:16S rRNA (cytosine967-C5)-methyltransferase
MSKDTQSSTTERTQAPQGANLANALLAAASLLAQVREGVSLTQAVAELPASIRPAAQSLGYNALRHLPLLIGVIGKFINRSLKPEVEDLLLVASSTLIPDSPNQYASHTLVNEAVKAASKSPKTLPAKGLINAVLRRMSENPDVFRAPIEEIAQNYPGWWFDKVHYAYPKQWQEIFKQNFIHPPMTLRVNTRKISVEEYKQHLHQRDIQFKDIPAKLQKLAPHAISLEKPVPVQQLPGFDRGQVSVQDLGAQIAVGLLGLNKDDLVLDACSAPGGKAAHILEVADVKLTAIDKDVERLSRVNENLSRLELVATVKEGDASDPASWWDGKLFDAILADVPCSASGIVRRHPDIPYLRREEDIHALSINQKSILSKLWGVLKPGGKLLFVTCSIFPEEGENQAKWFSKNHEDAVRLESLGQIVPSAWHDGFFFALFRKSE